MIKQSVWNAPIMMAVLMAGRGRGRYVYASSEQLAEHSSFLSSFLLFFKRHTIVDHLGLLSWVDLDTRSGREAVAVEHKVVVEREHAVKQATLVKRASPILSYQNCSKRMIKRKHTC